MMILGSEDVRLRPLQIPDAGELAVIANNRNIWNNVRDVFPHPYSKEDALRFIGICSKEKTPVTFAIDYKGSLAGVIGLVLQVDVYRFSAELGFWIGEPFWNRSIATRAVKIIAEYGFDRLGLIRIYANVFDFNTASQRVLEKAGFQLEAILKKAVVKNGKALDEYRYAVLKDENPVL